MGSREKAAICKPGRGAQRNPSLPAPRSRTSGLQDSEERNFCQVPRSAVFIMADNYRSLPHTAHGLSFQKKTIQLLGADVREHAGLRLRKDFSHKTKQEN